MRRSLGFEAADFDVGFIGDEDVSFFVEILIHKGLDANDGDLLVGNGNVVEVSQGL